MAKTKTKKSKPSSKELDGVYLLKLVFYLLLGSLWIRLSFGQSTEIGLPIGFIIGFAFSMHERFQIDRKIEYAVLVLAMFFGYFAPYALYLSL